MSNEFVENRKFWGLDGVIGRRDYIVNCLIIEVFEQFVVSVVMYAALIKNFHMINLFSTPNTYPHWYYWLITAIGVISSVFYYSNFMRRLRDITESADVQIIAGTLTLFSFVCYLKVVPTFL